MANRTWTDEQLIEATANNTTLSGIAKELGLKYGGYQAKTLKAKIRELNLDVSHLDRIGRSVFGTDVKEKFCRYHKEYEPIEDFGRTSSGATSACKKGLSEWSLSSQRRRKYNLSDEQYSSMEEFCDGVCQICQRKNGTRRLVVDHDHSCCPGKQSCGECVRGLLCTPCNTALGHVEDDIDRMRSMILYLEITRVGAAA